MTSQDMIDFNLMLREGSKSIKKNQYRLFEHILVDEYQDLAPLRRRFLKYLRSANKAKLFAVGDDWQLIFGFSGADPTYFRDFSLRERDPVIIKPSKIRRFPIELEVVSSGFVRKDPSLVDKQLETSSTLGEAAVIICFYTGRPENAISSVMKYIPHTEEHSMCVLGRFGFETSRVDNSIPSMTVHRAKGRDWDNVILMNGSGGKFGFPSGVEDDSVMKMVPLPEDQTIDKNLGRLSERRLFYVALTRSKNRVFILTPKEESGGLVSPFVKELLQMGSNYVGEMDIDKI